MLQISNIKVGKHHPKLKSKGNTDDLHRDLDRSGTAQFEFGNRRELSRPYPGLVYVPEVHHSRLLSAKR